MPDSRTSHTGTGAQTQFSVSFPYLARAHVSVTVGGVSTSFTWVDDTNINISPAPADQSAILIKRTTPDGIVAFSNGSALPEDDLNTAVLLAQYQTEEAVDEQAADDTSMDARMTAAEAELVTTGGRLDTLEAATLDTRLTAAEADIDDLESDVAGINSTLGTMVGDILTLGASTGNNATAIAGNSTSIADHESRIGDLEAVNADRFSVAGTGVNQTYSAGDPQTRFAFNATAVLDPDSGWNGLDTFTIPAGSGGLWHFTAIVTHDTTITAGESYFIDIAFTGGQRLRTLYTAPVADVNSITISGSVYLAAGEGVSVQIVDSGVNSGQFRTAVFTGSMRLNGFRVGD